MNQCKGICKIDYETIGLEGRQSTLWPSCATCRVRLDVEDKIWCPCCHGRLSWKKVRMKLGKTKESKVVLS